MEGGRRVPSVPGKGRGEYSSWAVPGMGRGNTPQFQGGGGVRRGGMRTPQSQGRGGVSTPQSLVPGSTPQSQGGHIPQSQGVGGISTPLPEEGEGGISLSPKEWEGLVPLYPRRKRITLQSQAVSSKWRGTVLHGNIHGLRLSEKHRGQIVRAGHNFGHNWMQGALSIMSA